jgi:branched-chain amino acid transport system ATP-binding protein
MSSILSIEDLSRTFGGVRALDNVRMEVSPSERKVIIGPNGAGKTTLFHAITGVIPVSSGKVRLNGADITRLPAHRRAALGLSRTFQITSLFKKLSVLENVLLGVQALDPAKYVAFRRQSAFRLAIDRARQLIEGFGLGRLTDRSIASLAYGEQRLVEILVTLATGPRILLLDEPTAGLSPVETEVVAERIQALPREITILMIEHDLDIAFRLCNRVAVMHRGQVLIEGTPEEIRANREVGEIYVGALDTP